MIRITLSRVTDFEALGRRWRTLETRANGSFFQSWTWTGCLAEERFPDPMLVEARDGGRTVALALFNRVRGQFGAETLALGETGDPRMDAVYIEHNGVLTEAGCDPALATSCLDAARRGRIATTCGMSPQTLSPQTLSPRALSPTALSSLAEDSVARGDIRLWRQDGCSGPGWYRPPRRLVASGIGDEGLAALRRVARWVYLRQTRPAPYVDLRQLRREGGTISTAAARIPASRSAARIGPMPPWGRCRYSGPRAWRRP